jgi:hypothetical protein
MSVAPAPQTDYEKNMEVSPKYDTQKLFPLEGTQSIPITSAGGQTFTMELPSVPYNLSRSYISMSLSVPAQGANTQGWAYMMTHPFRTIRLKTKGGLYICDLQNANYFVNMLAPYTTSAKKCDANPQMTSGGYYGDGIQNNNALVTNYKAFRPGQLNYNAFAVSVSSINYNEPSYLIGAAALNGALTINYRIDLGSIPHTIFSVDKDLYCGAEQLQLEFVFASTTDIGFFCTPTGAALNADLATPAAIVGDITASSITLYLCTEVNQEIVSALKAKYLAGGYSIKMDYPQVNYRQLSSTNQVLQLRINASHGRRLKRIYHSLYEGTSTLNNRYNRSEEAKVANGGAAYRILTSFHTELDNVRLQNFEVSRTLQEDHALMLPKLEGSLIKDVNIYEYNWLWCDNWDGQESIISAVEDSQIERGLDLMGREYAWTFNGTTNNANYGHYAIVVCQRDLVVSPAGISVV